MNHSWNRLTFPSITRASAPAPVQTAGPCLQARAARSAVSAHATLWLISAPSISYPVNRDGSRSQEP